MQTMIKLRNFMIQFIILGSCIMKYFFPCSHIFESDIAFTIKSCTRYQVRNEKKISYTL